MKQNMYWYKGIERTGKRLEVSFNKNGNPDGIRTEWFRNGNKKIESHYNDGILDGIWTEWYENSSKCEEGNFKNGKKDGKWTRWSENGDIKTEEICTDGVCVSIDYFGM